MPLGAASSSESAAADESSAKRRKTSVHEHMDARGAATTVENEQHYGIAKTVPITKKEPKPRRKFPMDTEDVAPAAQKDVAEDSFIVQAKTKRAKTRAKTTGPIAVEEVVPDALAVAEPAKGRPKRRAAAKATAKVTDDLIEESASIDDRRQVLPTTTKPKRIRKKPVVSEEVPAITEALVAAEEALLPTPEVSTTIAGAKFATGKKPKGRQTARCKRTTTKAPEVFCDAEVAQLAQSPHDSAQPEGEANPMAFNTPVATKKRKRADSVHRQPLLEADANVLRPSVSPEKDEKTAEVPRRAVSRTKRKAASKPKTAAKGNKRRRLSVERDDAADQQTHPQDVETAGSLSPHQTNDTKETQQRKLHLQPIDNGDANDNMIGAARTSAVQALHSPPPTPAAITVPTVPEDSPTDAQTAATGVRPVAPPAKRLLLRRDPETGDPARRETVRTVKHKTSPGLKRQLFSRLAHVSKAVNLPDTASTKAEEDVDWLFAPTVAKRAPAQSVNASQPTKRNSFSKLADVDLDDLMTSIASFAQVPKPGVVDGTANMGAPVVSQSDGVGKAKVVKSRRRK